jgi:hypothetical protein
MEPDTQESEGPLVRRLEARARQAKEQPPRGRRRQRGRGWAWLLFLGLLAVAGGLLITSCLLPGVGTETTAHPTPTSRAPEATRCQDLGRLLAPGRNGNC